MGRAGGRRRLEGGEGTREARWEGLAVILSCKGKKGL
jgi:hypothetical protein